jgi:general secretion pathway protein M
MNAWWGSLQPRERSVIIGGSTVLIAFLVLWLGLRPLFTHAQSARIRIEEKSLLLADLRATAAEMGSRPTHNAKMPAGNESLVVIVDRSTRETGLASALKRNQPAGTTGIRVRFENASFNQVMGWLGLLHSSYGIEIESAAFETTDQPGQVQASLTLQRGQP